jgi:murein DD-endopeptidase MepM/ murein hydrolase activator NlpD
MKKLFVLLLLCALVFGYFFWHWDGTPPAISWDARDAVGRKSVMVLEVRDGERGIRALDVVLHGPKGAHVLASESQPRLWLPWEQGLSGRTLEFIPERDFKDFSLPQGDFEIEVTVSDQPNLGILSRTSRERRTFRYDTIPPRVEVISRQHYIRQGGCETILYRVSDDAVASGVQVGGKNFVGWLAPGAGEGTRLAIFALDFEQPVETPMFLWAEDEAGNRSQVNFWKKTFPSSFRKRHIQVTDSFIQAVVPEILAHSPEISEKETLLDSYLEINRTLRDINHRRIEAMSLNSADRLLWEGPFLQLTNSQVEALFADHRTYYYQGKKVDEQTHLGFDLASLARSPVECSNDGVVVFADYLGIYGNCVIVDHGFGLQSLYGHLSSIDVREGETVRRGQRLGHTGQTGLAGGDHLHFGMILQGVHVNPIEWWDPRWVELRIGARLRGEAGGEAEAAAAPRLSAPQRRVRR